MRKGKDPDPLHCLLLLLFVKIAPSPVISVPGDWAACAAESGHDRGDQPEGQGPPRRRHQGEGQIFHLRSICTRTFFSGEAMEEFGEQCTVVFA